MIQKNSNRKFIISWLPAFIWIIVIYIFSAQDSTISGGESMCIATKLHEILKLPIDQIEVFIREGSHFLEYLILGIFIYIGISSTFVLKRRRIVICTVLACILYAISDEIHQIFVPGRTFQVIDLSLDSLGCITGSLTASFISQRKNRARVIS